MCLSLSLFSFLFWAFCADKMSASKPEGIVLLGYNFTFRQLTFSAARPLSSARGLG